MTHLQVKRCVIIDIIRKWFLESYSIMDMCSSLLLKIYHRIMIIMSMSQNSVVVSYRNNEVIKNFKIL